MTPQDELLAAHIAATRTALQVIVLAMESAGTIDRGDVAALLGAAMAKRADEPLFVEMLDDMRRSLLD